MRESGGDDEAAILDRMRADWDRRAREDHKLHIATGHAGSDEEFRASGKQDLEEIVLDGLHLAPEATVLEIGCGVGRLLAPLSERTAKAFGVDIAPTMIEKARAYAAERPNAEFHLTDGLLGGFADGSLDFVYSFIVFQHIPDKAPIAAYVREAARVLSPGGLFRFQVDGRWRERAGRTPDTYDGVVYAPEEIRALVASVGLEVAEEWGADTHYHRLTARRPGADPRVLLFPCGWDRTFLEELLASLGRPRREAEAVVSGRATLRAALDGVEERFASLGSSEFVSQVFRLLLRREPDADGLAYHAGILDSGFEDRASLIETVLMGREFRGLARPPLDPTWVVRESIGPERADATTVSGLADVLDRELSSVPADRFVESAFELVCARHPDPTTKALYEPVLATDPASSRRALLLRLLGRGERPPAPPPANRTAALLDRSLEAEGRELRRGESFVGEAAVAHRAMAGSAGLADAEFVRSCYALLLGRVADEGGADYYAGKITSGQMSRPELVREFLWSDELRRVDSAG